MSTIHGVGTAVSPHLAKDIAEVLFDDSLLWCVRQVFSFCYSLSGETDALL